MTENINDNENLVQDGFNENFNYGFDDIFQLENIENRHLYLNREIDEYLAGDIVYHIMRYNSLDKDISEEKRTPIILYINSPGGNVTDGFSIISVCELSKTPVFTVNIGEACSMAFLVYLAGHKRFSFPYSTFLLHDGSSFCYNSTAKAKDCVEFETGQLATMIKTFVLENTNINSYLYDEKYRIEWFMLPSESKALGITDFIIGDKDCNLNNVL